MARKASEGKADRLAVIVSGPAARAVGALGALGALDAAGLQPDVLVGVSGGAIAAALYAACGSGEAAREALYELVGRTCWQDLADLDVAALRDLPERPYETSGFLRGDALQQALLDGPLGHHGFQHLQTPLFVVACDLNSGRELVFGNQTQDAATVPYKLFARTAADLDRVNVATACRASCLTPGLFQPLSLDHYCVVDGTLRLRQALTVAASQPGVTRILWLHAGLDENEEFSLVTDYAGQSFAAGLLHGLAVATAEAFDPHTGDPLLQGLSVRFVNLAVGSVGAVELTKTQALFESGRRTVGALLAKPELAGPALFTTAGEAIAATLAQDTDETDGPRWQVTVGQGGRDVVAVVDRMPPLQQEFGYEFEDYLTKADLARLTPKEPIATAAWARATAEAQLGLAALTGLFAQRTLGYVWQGLTAGLRTAWRAVGLDSASRKLSQTAAEGTLKVMDTLRPAKPGDDSPGAS